ncbi:MAG: DUF3343 domain-containing protein [Firmicutes bacterium]|nr:DUF3343 domain-containing protein [Bacillota bacterium]
MNEYVATFFTHYDALLFQRRAEALSISGQLAPVPRKLSSSCGTCMFFSSTPEQMEQLAEQGEYEQLAIKEGLGYKTLKDNR